MQKARRSSIQSTKTYKAFQAFQPQDLTQAFQFYKDIPDIPVIHDISSPTGISTRSSISSIRMLILHSDWFPPETPLSASRIQDINFQRKGDVAI